MTIKDRKYQEFPNISLRTVNTIYIAGMYVGKVGTEQFGRGEVLFGGDWVKPLTCLRKKVM